MIERREELDVPRHDPRLDVRDDAQHLPRVLEHLDSDLPRARDRAAARVAQLGMEVARLRIRIVGPRGRAIARARRLDTYAADLRAALVIDHRDRVAGPVQVMIHLGRDLDRVRNGHRGVLRNQGDTRRRSLMIRQGGRRCRAEAGQRNEHSRCSEPRKTRRVDLQGGPSIVAGAWRTVARPEASDDGTSV